MLIRTLVALGLASLAFPSLASPATVSVVHLSALYEASPGETNDVRVTSIEAQDDGWHVILEDLGAPLTPGDGCAPAAGAAVACLVPFDFVVLTAHLGDGNDTFTARGTCDEAPGCLEVFGEGGNDHIVGGAGADFLYGNWGNDVLEGLRGNGYGYDPSGDVLDGGQGDDSLDGGRDPDMLIGGPGADVLAGGGGPDTVSYERRRTGVRADTRGDADDGRPGERDRIAADVERLIGSRGADVLTGDDGPNDLYGRQGNDVLQGKGGADQLEGDTGCDRLVGGTGKDFLFGAFTQTGHPGDYDPGCGRDWLLGGPDRDHLRSVDGHADRVRGGPGFDLATIDPLDDARNIEHITVYTAPPE